MTKQEAETAAAKVYTTIGLYYEDKHSGIQFVVQKVVVSEQDNNEWIPLVYGYIMKKGTYYVCDATKFPDAVLAINKP